MLPYLTNLIKKLGPKIGAKVVIEPEWRVSGQIIYKNGVVRSLHFYSLDLNNLASSKIAKDKDFAKFFLHKAGYNVAPGKTIFEKAWAQRMKSDRDISYAIKYAKGFGYPLIVKPNSRTQGLAVALVRDAKELKGALAEVFKEDKVAILEKYMPGRDYRVVVLDGKIISAYERIALSIVGDGKHSVLELLKAKQKNLILDRREAQIDLKDPRIKLKLKHQGLSFSSVLSKGRKIYLLDNANLSAGGDPVDVTESIHPSFKKIAVSVTKKMGLMLCGVDIMVTKGDITKNLKDCKYYIIEINAAPGLDHYVTTGKKQEKIVEAMYLKVLKALGKKD